MAKSKTSETKLTESRRLMVKALEEFGIVDQEILSAFERVPRHRFLPDVMHAMAYEIAPLVLAEDLIGPSPTVAASALDALKIGSGSRVLEVGTGTGYLTALLAELSASVYTVEVDVEREETARKLLGTLGYRNVFCRSGCGLSGWQARGPFDAIMVNVALEQLPRDLLSQLTPEGRLVFPIKEEFISAVLVERHEGEFITTDLGPAQFPMARVQKLDDLN
jgi:protein-L-isoaspartate(D-aspartate) O-methyltransferase